MVFFSFCAICNVAIFQRTLCGSSKGAHDFQISQKGTHTTIQSIPDMKKCAQVSAHTALCVYYTFRLVLMRTWKLAVVRK